MNEDYKRLNLPTQNFPSKLDISIGQAVGGHDQRPQEKRRRKKRKETLGTPVGGVAHPVHAFSGTVHYLPRVYKEHYMNKAKQILNMIHEAEDGEEEEDGYPVFYRIVDLDERGSYRAHVEDENGNVVFEYSNEIEDPETGETTEGELWLVEDGFMDHVDDLAGLENYLKSTKFIPKDARLQDGEQNMDKYEGKIITPPYAVHVVARQGYQTPSVWDIKSAGKPTDANLAKWVEMYHQSLEPGGANAHLGKGARLVKAEIRRNVAGGDVVAKWSESPSGESLSLAGKILKDLDEVQGDFTPQEQKLVDQGYIHLSDYHMFGYTPLFRKDDDYKFVYQGKIMTAQEMYDDLVDNWRPASREEQDWRVSTMKSYFSEMGVKV